MILLWTRIWALFLLAEQVVTQQADLFVVVESPKVAFTKVQSFTDAENVVIDGSGGVPQIGCAVVPICGD
ncbi:MAG: hypothetical protein ACK5Q5_20050 [Planctomycetaceae bacterium]